MTTPSISTSGYASSGSDRSKSSGRSNGIHHHHQGMPESSSIGSSNGYAADHSAQPSLPSNVKSSELAKRSSDIAPLSFQPAQKRLRTNCSNAELNFMASKAKEVIELAGLVYPKLQTNTSRMFPPKSGVNTSGVIHKYSSQCASPFLVETKYVNHNYMGCPYEITSLVQSTSSYYSLVTENIALPASFAKVVQMIEQNNTVNTSTSNDFEREACSDTESSTSSVTVSDLGGANCPRASNFKHSDGNDSDPQRRFSSSNAEVDVGTANKNQSVATTAIITIGTALEISRRPRILTSARAPYNVVQVNAAFLRLTQSKSTNDFLGKPLQDVLHMQCSDDGDKINNRITSLATGLKASYTTMQKVSIPGYPSLLRSDVTTTSNMTEIQRISIVPVGVPPSKNDSTADGKVTHFAIKFSINEGQDRSRPASTSSHLSNTSNSNNHRTSKNDSCAIHVMG